MMAYAAHEALTLEFFRLEKGTRQKDEQSISAMSRCQRMQMCIQRNPLNDGDSAATVCQRYRDVKLINRFL